MRIPEGSQESDFKGRRLCVGRLGDYVLELYVSWVWRGVRHLHVVGASVRYDRVWFRRAAWAVLLLVALTGCGGFEPSGAQPFVPPLSYRVVYAEAKECAEVPAKWAKPFDALRFYSVPDPFLHEDGTPLAGLYDGGNVYINERYLDRAWIIRHELLHSFGYGDNPHPKVFTRCNATWENHDTTRLAL